MTYTQYITLMVLWEEKEGGEKLRDKALAVPKAMIPCMKIYMEDAITLKKILDKMMQSFGE